MLAPGASSSIIKTNTCVLFFLSQILHGVDLYSKFQLINQCPYIACTDHKQGAVQDRVFAQDSQSISPCGIVHGGVHAYGRWAHRRFPASLSEAIRCVALSRPEELA